LHPVPALLRFVAACARFAKISLIKPLLRARTRTAHSTGTNRAIVAFATREGSSDRQLGSHRLPTASFERTNREARPMTMETHGGGPGHRSPAPKLGRDGRHEIGRALGAMYDEVVRQGVPAHIVDLLNDLARADAGRQARS
jgi:hypothetical protein